MLWASFCCNWCRPLNTNRIWTMSSPVSSSNELYLTRRSVFSACFIVLAIDVKLTDFGLTFRTFLLLASESWNEQPVNLTPLRDPARSLLSRNRGSSQGPEPASWSPGEVNETDGCLESETRRAVKGTPSRILLLWNCPIVMCVVSLGSDEVSVRIRFSIGLRGSSTEFHVSFERESYPRYAAGGELPDYGLGQAPALARMEESRSLGQPHAASLFHHIQEWRRSEARYAHASGHKDHG